MEKKSKNKYDDMGLANSVSNAVRMINSDGRFNVIREGGDHRILYQSLVEMSWLQFFLIVVAGFIFINALFALLFLLAGIDGIAGLEPSGSFFMDWAYTTFFSIQTFTTVGYGAISPNGFWQEIIASLDALVGLMSFALVTGLVYARFSKPTAHILFSDVAIITPYKNGKSFQFRIVNKRNSKILDLGAIVVLTWVDSTSHLKTRRYFTLPLEISRIALFPVNWTIVHVIDAKSPLYQKSKKELAEMKAEFIILIKGFDETYSQMVHINRSYVPEEMLWGVQFKKMYSDDPAPHKGITLRMDMINATEPILLE